LGPRVLNFGNWRFWGPWALWDPAFWCLAFKFNLGHWVFWGTWALWGPALAHCLGPALKQGTKKSKKIE
jgi:hypothetical protein